MQIRQAVLGLVFSGDFSRQLTTTVSLYSMTEMITPKTFTLDELATLAELPRRTVRYYIQCGLVDRPQGIGKGALYTERHI